MTGNPKMITRATLVEIQAQLAAAIDNSANEAFAPGASMQEECAHLRAALHILNREVSGVIGTLRFYNET